MKYIRTKDGIYVPCGIKGYEDYFACLKGNANVYRKSDLLIIKESEILEELCDEFVVFEESGNNGFPLTCPKEKFKEIKSYVILGMINNFNIWLKGAIWTSKGLIYVAKMNDKGELELL